MAITVHGCWHQQAAGPSIGTSRAVNVAGKVGPQAVDRLSAGIEFDIHPPQGIGNVAIKRTQEERVLVTESGVKAATRELRRTKKVRERRGVIAARPEHAHRAFDGGFDVETPGATTGQPHWGSVAHCRYIDQLVYISSDRFNKDCRRLLIAPFPIDDIPERGALEIGAQVVAEEIDRAMTVLITGGRDMRRDQHPGIGPEPWRWRVLELADIDIERCAAQMIALERVGEGLLVDDLTPGDVDEHAPRLHRCKAVLVEETGRLRCPLAADHHEIALRQEPIEIPGAAKLAESRWQGLVWVRVAAGADDPHAEGDAEFTDIEPDSAGAHDARSLTFQ